MEFLKIFLGALVLALLAGPLLEWLETKLVYKDAGYGVARRKAVDAEMSLGASYLDAQETLFLREMHARVRHEASDAVQDDPRLWLQCIDEAKKRAIAEITTIKPHLAQRFSQSIESLTYGHILYPAEAKLVDRLWLGDARRPSPDQMAAVRIVR